MKNLKNTFLGLIDTGASQAKSLVESFNDIVNSFDMDAQLAYLKERKNDLIKKSNELFNDFSDLIKQVKDSLSDFSVTVPYDEESGEKFSYEVVDGRLNIEVTYSDETTGHQHKTTVLIPSNCNLEELSYEVNKTKKCLTITIPKNLKLKEDVEEPKTEPNTPEDAEPPKKPQKKTVKKKASTKKKVSEPVEETSAAEEPIEEQPTEQTNEGTVEEQISSKLAKRLQNNVNRYAKTLKRDEKGRYVRK